MTATVLAQSFVRPEVDWHALAPEIIIVATIALALIVDVFTGEESRWTASSIAGIGMLAALVPLFTLAVEDGSRSMFGGLYVVDDFALVLKGLFLVAGYITVLLSTNQIAEGDYHEGEYYLLLLASVFGMVVMSSSRDLITIFIALEMLSIPAYLLASWRKRTQTGIEAGMKYYLMGVFATGVMLYGMSLIFGGTGSTLLTDIGARIDGDFGQEPVAVLGIVFVLVGFGFKVSAVPFHNWAPDTYEGAPTPVTAFLSVASKSAGFVAILQLVFIGFLGRSDTVRPLMFVLATLTMTVGNVIALRQTNIVRLFAYSSVAQAGFILAPLAVIDGNDPGTAETILSAVVVYLLVYTVVNLGAFAVIIAVSRRTRTGEIRSWGGLFDYAPGLGFYTGGGGAGRRRDFLTSPEVGPLFGAVVGRALDAWWEELGRPDPYQVVEAGAGPGTLARTVLAAGPSCAAALRLTLVEPAAVQWASHPPDVDSRTDLPDRGELGSGPVVVLANELLDNLPFALVELTDTGWAEIRVALAGDHGGGPVGQASPAGSACTGSASAEGRDAAAAHAGRSGGPAFVEVRSPLDARRRRWCEERSRGVADVGARLPVQADAAGWLRDALAVAAGGRVVAVDYADTSPSLAARPWTEWVRTYTAHGRGGSPLEDPGGQDVTCEVAVDQLSLVRAPDRDRSQTDFLRAHGLVELVADGRRRWHDAAAAGGLDAIAGRSRVHEAEALTDPDGLGAFRVLEWIG